MVVKHTAEEEEEKAKAPVNPRHQHRQGKEGDEKYKITLASSRTKALQEGWENAFKVDRCPKTGKLFPEQKWSIMRRYVERVIMHPKFEPVVGFVVLMNFVCVALEADIRTGAVENTPVWLRPANLLFIGFYTAEAVSKLYVERCVFFSSAWNNFDLVIVVCGLIGEILEGAMDSVSVLRTIRLARLLRVTRLFTAFVELWALIRGLLACMRTLLWAIILMLTTTTVWSIFAVELINPEMAALAEEGAWTSCSWCEHAFSSVMHANLTFFQIISGDGYGTLARPIIEKHPWTAFIFLGVIFTMTFGLLNLITAVIVDNAAQGRQADMKFMAAERERQGRAMKNALLTLCEDMDLDDSGTISLDELQKAAYELPQFMHILKVMDVGTDDLDYVFEILDADESGEVSYEEFADQLWKMRSQEQQTILMFLRHQVQQIWKHTKRHQKEEQRSVGHTPVGHTPVQSPANCGGHHPVSLPVMGKPAIPVSPNGSKDTYNGSAPQSTRDQNVTMETLQSRIDELNRLLTQITPCNGEAQIGHLMQKASFGGNEAMHESEEKREKLLHLSEIGSRLEDHMQALARLAERLEQCFQYAKIPRYSPSVPAIDESHEGKPYDKRLFMPCCSSSK